MDLRESSSEFRRQRKLLQLKVLLSTLMVVISCNQANYAIADKELVRSNASNNPTIYPKLSSPSITSANQQRENGTSYHMKQADDSALTSARPEVASEHRSSTSASVDAPISTTSTATTTLASIFDQDFNSTKSIKQPNSEITLKNHQDKTHQSSKKIDQLKSSIKKQALISSVNSRERQQQQQQQKHQQRHRDPIDQLATNQLVSFADPATAASDRDTKHQQTHQKQKHSDEAINGLNKWTHFGARLKPLTKVLGPTSTNDRSRTKTHGPFNANNLAAEQSRKINQMYPISSTTSSNQLTPDSGADRQAAKPADDNAAADDDDDQDNEDLLYKMMQQQGLMTSSMWQKPQLILSSDGQTTDNGPNQQPALASGDQAPVMNQGRSLAIQRAASVPGNGNNNNNNNNRVIKLLKSYSHIHQVDDSDDQIRGTYTRLQSSHQPSGDNANSWQQANNNNRQSFYQGNENSNLHHNNKHVRKQQQQQQADKHIFISSRPLATARANPNDRNIDGKQLASELGSNINPDPLSDDENGQGDESSNPDASNSAEEDDFECPNNGIFADEASGCQAYHVCQSGAQVQQKFQCPLGTLFNNIILTCDFAHNVQCGKSKSIDKPQPFGETQDQVRNQPEVRPPSQQQQQQQHRQASVQTNRASHIQSHRTRQPTRAGQQPKPSASNQEQNAGPRHLKIGSQYIRHQQGLPPTSVAKAVNPYPPSSSASPVLLGGNNIDNGANDDDNDDPVVPLVPATIPPRTLASSSSLPYNPPPMATVQTEPRQTAHRSQYPPTYISRPSRPIVATTQGYYQGDQNLVAYSRGYGDGASSESPIFVSREESQATTTEPAPRTQQQAELHPVNAPINGADQQQHSFDLVINHVAPTRQSTNTLIEKKRQPFMTATNDYKPKEQQQPLRQQHHKQLPQIQRKPEMKPQQQQVAFVSNKQLPIASDIRQSFPRARESKPRQQYSQYPIRQEVSGNLPRQQMASQPAIVHMDANTASAGQRPNLVDLTNDDKKASGVSSEAMNDGLLLIVRHGVGSSPIQVGMSAIQDQSQQDYGRQQQQSQQRKGEWKVIDKAASGGQAFAVDPTIVRPDSPIDAQLFPNVQRVLANVHSQTSDSNLASQTTQFVQHVDGQQQQRQQQGSYVVSQPLPPLEPPKPNLHHNKSENRSRQQGQQLQSSAMELQSAAASSAAQTSIATGKPTNKRLQLAASESHQLEEKKQREQKARSKRNKRLKPAASPTSERPEAANANPISSAVVMTIKATTTTPTSSSALTTTTTTTTSTTTSASAKSNQSV